MATARRRALRTHAAQQAALVWIAKEIDIAEFVTRGDLAEMPSLFARMPPELRAKMDEKISQYMDTGTITVN